MPPKPEFRRVHSRRRFWRGQGLPVGPGARRSASLGLSFPICAVGMSWAQSRILRPCRGCGRWGWVWYLAEDPSSRKPPGPPQLPELQQQGALGLEEGPGGVTWPWSSGRLMASCARGVGQSPRGAGYVEPRRRILAPRAAPGRAEAAGPARRGGRARGSPSHPASQGAPRPGSRGAAAPCALARPLRAWPPICGRGLPCTRPGPPELRPEVPASVSW